MRQSGELSQGAGGTFRGFWDCPNKVASLVNMIEVKGFTYGKVAMALRAKYGQKINVEAVKQKYNALLRKRKKVPSVAPPTPLPMLLHKKISPVENSLDDYPVGSATRAILSLARNGCRWPSGEAHKGTFTFCNRDRGTHQSYCDEHRPSKITLFR